jgi:hypothetical protein
MVRRIVAACLVSAAVGALTLIQACGSTADSCAAQCGCKGNPKDATCLKTCEATRTTSENAAQKAGCTDEFDADETCAVDHGTCEGGDLVTTTSCSTQVNAYLSCLLAGGATTSTGSK